MFLPGETHRKAVDREVDVGDKGTLLDLGTAMALGTSNVGDDLFDAQLDVAGATLVVHHAHVFQANKRLEDFGRVGEDEGASSFLGHTSSLKHLRLLSGDPHGRDPANFR